MLHTTNKLFDGVADRVMYARNQQKVLGRVPVVGGQPINEEMAVVSIFPLLYLYYVTIVSNETHSTTVDI